MITESQAEHIIDLLSGILKTLEKMADAPRSAPAVGGATNAHGLTGWRAKMLPAFAKYDKDVPLGLLGVKSMEYWQNWQPKGWEKKDGTPMPASPADLAFRKALDEAQAEIDAGTHVVPQYSPRKEGDDRPKPGASSRPAPRSRPTPPPDDGASEDVPF